MTVGLRVEGHRRLAKTVGAVYGALWAATLAGAAVTAAAPGAKDVMRSLLGFTLARQPGSINEAGAILATNGRIAAAVVVCGVARGRLTGRRKRTLLDALMVTLGAANAVLVGIAAAAYGRTSFPFLVHLPVEWAAFALAGATYAAPAPTARRLAACGALLAVAAAAESYVTP